MRDALLQFSCFHIGRSCEWESVVGETKQILCTGLASVAVLCGACVESNQSSLDRGAYGHCSERGVAWRSGRHHRRPASLEAKDLVVKHGVR